MGLIQASRPVPRVAASRASSRKQSPQEMAAAAAVIQAVADIESKVAAGKSGPPDDPGKTCDEHFDWKHDEDGVPYWTKGAAHLRQTYK